MVRLDSERLIIREADWDDIPAIVDYLKLNKSAHAPFDPIREKEYYSEQFWQKKLSRQERELSKADSVQLYLFRKLNPNRVIGKIGFSGIVRGAFQACYLGFAIDQAEQGNGYMSEALKPSIQFAFTQLKLHRIMANYMPQNLAGARVLEKLGFTVEGTAKAYLKIAGQWEDHILTSLTNPDPASV
ncbi:MAG: GNAT family N-acetyltransferase [bacterium]|nr:GNAT family N-acetyltransferase [bacterium]